MKNKGFMAESEDTGSTHFVIDNGDYVEVSIRPEDARKRDDDYEFYVVGKKEFSEQFKDV